MKVIAITEENLEDLLAYDDLFLDYFNAFLALPVFPQALGYNRLTGSFEELVETKDITSEGDDIPESPPYGATDEEREGMLQWAKEQRLPLFLSIELFQEFYLWKLLLNMSVVMFLALNSSRSSSTELFREFKLCKLLLRPLDDRYSARERSSNLLRGYSRQTESYISSLSNSVDNSGNDALDEGFDITSWSDVYQGDKEERTASRAWSMPVGAQYGIRDSQVNEPPPLLTKYHTTGAILPKLDPPVSGHKKSAVTRFSEKVETIPDDENQDGRHNNEMLKDETTVSFAINNDIHSLPGKNEDRRKSALKEHPTTPGFVPPPHSFLYARAVSAPLNYEDYQRMSAYRDFDAMFGEPEPADDGTQYVLFTEDGVSEEQTEADVKSMEGRHNMTYQQLKEHIIGSYVGMEALTHFLSNTAGRDLLNFWLDCENFKDTMEDFDEVTNMEKRNRLYRDIQDKYRMTLSVDAKNQITKSASRPNVSLSHTIFIRTQYDVLRRLRTYWLPRFLTHLEYSDDIFPPEDDDDDTMLRSHRSMTQSIFPSISLVKSLPTNPADVLDLTKHNSWDMVCKGVRKHDNVQSSQSRTDRSVVTTAAGPFKERLLIALTADKSAGGPFRSFLERSEYFPHLWSLLFWQDITEYGMAEDRSADRLLRLGQAWTIYTKYIALDSSYCIGLNGLHMVQISEKLNASRDFIEASIFDPARDHSVRLLQDSWIRFLKEDLKTFLEVKSDESGSPPSTADVIDISVTEDNQMVITRPRPWVRRHSQANRYPPSSPSERGRRLRRALSIADTIDEERRSLLKKNAQERRKEMEKERRKAIRAAKQRQKEAKNVKASQGKGEADEFSLLEHDEAPRDKPITFTDILQHKQLLQLFKKYLLDTDKRDALNMVQLSHDVTFYQNITGGKDSKQKRDAQANYIYKTYVDGQSRKHTSFPDKLQAQLRVDKDRPKSATLREMQAFCATKIDEAFKGFLDHQARVLGVSVSVLSGMSVAEISLRMEPDASMTSASWKKNTRGGKAAQTQSTYQKEFAKWVDFTSLSLKQLTDLLNESRHDDSFMSSASSRQIYFLKEKTVHVMTMPHKHAHRRKRNKKRTGRIQPSKDDKVELLLALNQSVVGELSLRMLYFYKYLVKHGESDNMPLIHNDLIFYIEILKFKECSHSFADEEMLKRKVQTIQDCFLDSHTPPTLQVDLPSDVQGRAIRAAQKYVSGKDIASTIFDEAQFAVFKELLPYWAGFRKSYAAPKSNEKPVTKLQKLLKKRLENIENYKVPKPIVSLPAIHSHSMAPMALTFSLNEGIKIREIGVDDPLQSRDGRRTSMDPYRKRRQTTMDSISTKGDASRASSLFVK